MCAVLGNGPAVWHKSPTMTLLPPLLEDASTRGEMWSGHIRVVNSEFQIFSIVVNDVVQFVSTCLEGDAHLVPIQNTAL